MKVNHEAISVSPEKAPKRAHELEWAVHPHSRRSIVPIDDIGKPIGGSIDEASDLERYARVIAETRYHELSNYAHKPTKAEAEAVAAQIVVQHNATMTREVEMKRALLASATLIDASFCRGVVNVPGYEGQNFVDVLRELALRSGK